MSTGTGATGITSDDITADSVRELLSDRKVFPGLPDDLDENAELVLDSLGLVWLLHVVEERYGLVVEPTDEDIAGLTSLRRLTGYLRAAQTGSAEGTEGGWPG
ncbi:acyl carrier protein [Streptomyces sp. NPDC020898]|uniref:acyl carrier protein n=1 Tax=Streptomyces sp. NPDC020898 TaxID=3365101 RepID=UPI00379FEB66